MLTESFSGPKVMQAIEVEFDWGTINPGDTVGLVTVPGNAADEVVRRPYWPCPLSPMPVGTNTFCVPANIDTAPAILLIANNTTGAPIFVGVKKYVILRGELNLLLP